MNDEDLARRLFARAFDAGAAGEPADLPSIDRIAARGRQASRARQGSFAAGTVALAGVVTAGVVAGPSFFRGGVGLSTTGQASASKLTNQQAPKISQAPTKKPIASPCATPPQIDWVTLIESNLPSTATVTMNPKPSATSGVSCSQFGAASRIEALFSVANPDAVVQIDVSTGDLKANAFRARPTESPTGAAQSGKLAALKSELAKASGLPQDTNSAKPSSAPPNHIAAPSCSDADGARLCVSEVAKGGYVGIDVELTRTSSTPLVVDVIGSAAAPTGSPGQQPLSGAQLTAIANAVAAAF